MYGNLDPYANHLTNGAKKTKNPFKDDKPRVTPEYIDNLTLADYGWTPEAIKNSFIFGIDIKDENGNELDKNFYNYLIETGIDQAEQELDIAILPRYLEEEHDYNEQEFNSYMFTKTYKRPIVQVEELKLDFAGQTIYDYPSDWWKVYNRMGQIQLFPTTLMKASGSGFNNNAFGAFPKYLGSTPQGYNRTFAPQMINVGYVAGMLPKQKAGITREYEMPHNLQTLVTKYALRELFQVGGRLIIGAGIASKTLSIDGVSETIETTQSSMYGGYSAEILQIDKDIQEILGNLRSYFGSNMVSL